MVDSSALCDSLANRVRIIQSIVPKANDVEMSSQQSTALEHLCLVMQDCVAFIQKFKLKSSFVRFVQSNSTKKKYEGLCQKLSDVQLDLQTAFLVDLSASQQAILVELRSPVCIEEAWQKTLHETMYRIHNDHEETMALVQQQQDEQRAFLSQFADIDVVAALRDIGTLRGRMQDMYGIMEKVAKATSPPYMRPISSASVHIFPDRVLGVGAFGTVYHGTLDGAPCAVKMVLLSIHDKDAMAQFHREASICQRLRHPNCLQSYGWFERDSKPYLVTALAQRSLSDLFHCDESDDSIVTRLLSLSGRIRILKEVACGMRHIALKGIVHRDLKTCVLLFFALVILCLIVANDQMIHFFLLFLQCQHFIV
jgi:hypothetical protein